MNIVCTEKAIAQWTERIGNNEAKVKLTYSTEGCGCVNNGVAELWIIAHEAEFDQLSLSPSYPIYYDTRHAVFFEDELHIDYNPDNRVFVLKSKHQIYNARMLLYDKREQHV